MALLEGLVGGGDMVQKFGQQQFQNKLSRDKFDEQKRQYDQSYAENVHQFNVNDVYNSAASKSKTDLEAREAVTRANDQIYETYDVLGIISKDRMSLDTAKIRQGIESGDAATEQVLLGIATQFGNLPEGSKATSIQAIPGGGYAITVTNADGSTGAVTEDGKSESTSKVVNFDAGQLSRLANSEFRRNIVTNTSKFNPTDMRNRLDQIGADSDKQEANDQIADAAYLEYEKQVLDALPQDAAVQRSAKSAIAEGGPEVTEAMAKDAGIAPLSTTVQAPTDAASNEAQDAAAPSVDTPATPFDIKSVDRSTKGGRLIRSIEGGESPNPLAKGAEVQKRPEWFKNRQTEKLMDRKKKLESNIAKEQGNSAPRMGNMDSFMAKEFKKDKAELAQIDAYLEKDKPALFTQDAETDALAAQTAGKSSKEIEAGLNDGSIKVNQGTVQRVAQQLRAEGFEELRDLRRLRSKDAAIARAAILASTSDATIRKQMSDEITNIFDNVEGSPTVNRKDELALADKSADRSLNYKKYYKSMNDSQRAFLDAANEQGSDLMAAALKIYAPEGEDGDLVLGLQSAKKFLRSKEFSAFNMWLKQSDRTDLERDNALIGMTGTLSMTIASLAAEEAGGRGVFGKLRESLQDLIYRDEVEEGFDPGDFDASRITVDDPKNPTMLYYNDGDGLKLDEDAGLKQLKGLHPELYNNAIDIAKANTRRAIASKANEG